MELHLKILEVNLQPLIIYRRHIIKIIFYKMKGKQNIYLHFPNF